MVKYGLNVIPGYKICPSCKKKVLELRSQPTIYEESLKEDDNFNEGLDHNLSVEANKNILRTSSTFNELDLSPVKLHSMPHQSLVKQGKRKIEQASFELTKRVASILDVDQNILSRSGEDQSPCMEVEQKAQDLDYLVSLMKDKMKCATRRQKIQILTITQRSWSLRKAANEFQVSKTTVQKARNLRDENGILAMPAKSERNKLDENLIKTVKEFYCNDENTRQLPGKKDCISISKKQYMAKRLILCTLKELYEALKEKYPGLQIGFSKFASLRPKWCISVGPKGTHAVCVCTIHQNLKLMLDAVNLEKSYHELIDMIVCSRESKTCMVRRCSLCPGIIPIEEYLTEKLIRGATDSDVLNLDSEDDLSYDDVNCEEETEIKFKQWTTTDRAELVSQSSTVKDFIALLCVKLDNITSYSYIARSQAAYLRKKKETLEEGEVIAFGDFAENFKFVIQDEIQGYHWNHQQCTLHPVVLYFRSDQDSQLSSQSICFISNDLNHDVNFVYKIMSETVAHKKCCLLEDVKKISYFPGGCAGQYKNCKNFINLCNHQADFSVACEWNFFATSHRKSPCDGIGGTVKKLTAMASLQRTSNNLISIRNV